MNYIVLDLEWNQRLKGQDRITEPVRLRGEIIQFGAVKLDESFTVTDTFKILISPVYYREMHQKVSEITDITDADLRKGLSFTEAFAKFSSWCGDEYVFLVWGIDDLDMLCDNMQLHNIDTDCIPITYNLQLAFDNQISKEHRQISLARAMEMVDEPALKFHDALNDALNTAQLCLHLDMKNGLSGCELTRRSRRHTAGRMALTDKTEKVYQSRKQALRDPELICFCCAETGEAVRCSGFIEQSSRRFMAVGKTDSGKEYFVRFNFRKWAEKEFTVSRVVYEMDEEGRLYYKKRKKKAQQAKAKYFQKKSK